MTFWGPQSNTTIRKHLEWWKSLNFCKSKPLWKMHIEGIKVSICKDIKMLPEEIKLIGEEMFTLYDKTFITDPTLLKYVDKPLMHVFSAHGIGIDGEGNERKWHGVEYCVLCPEEFE